MPKNVLIVGAGPTGLTAALELTRFGIPVRLIEKRDQPDVTSRALGVQARTLELMEQRGLAEQFVRCGNPACGASLYGDGKRISRIDFSRIDSRYAYLLLIPQVETERILREALEKAGGAVEWSVEAFALGQPEKSESVTAALRHKDGGLEEVECEYLISAEGAHSIVRHSLGLEFEGKSLNNRYALGDFFIDGDLPGSDLHIFSSQFGFMGLFPLGEGRFRLIASDPLSRPDESAPPSLDELQSLYDQRSFIPAHFHDMQWSSWFHINSRMIRSLRERRAFFGGDSAHIHSPAGGQGMNTGIQDMINLCWKLALVMKGAGKPRLLDTYDDDRLPVIRHVLNRTEALTDAIGSQNAILRSIFVHLAPWLAGKEVVQENAVAQISQIALNYRSSPLSVNDVHGGELRAGDRLRDEEVTVLESPEGQHAARLFSLMDPSSFTLFCRNVDDPRVQAELQEQLNPWLGLISSYRIATPRESQPAIVLVRPDGYVGFLGGEKSIPAIAKYCSDWLTSP